MILLATLATFLILLLLSLADRILPGGGGDGRAAGGGPAAAAAWLDHCLSLAKLGAAGDPVIRLRRLADGAGRDVHRAGGTGPGAGGLAARRAGHVGDRGVVFLQRHLRIEDGRGLGAGFRIDAIAEESRLSRGRWGVPDRRRHGDGHAGPAGNLHDRDQRGDQPVRGRVVPGGVHSRGHDRRLPVRAGADPGAFAELAEGYPDQLCPRDERH